MLGVILCYNLCFMLPLINNQLLISYWYNILNNICSKIIIIINDDYKNIIYNILGKNINIISTIDLIKNEKYDLCVYVKCENIINHINFNIIDKIKDTNLGGVIEWNNKKGLWIFKKEIEILFITDNYINNTSLFITENIPSLLWNVNNINEYKNYINFLTIPNRYYIKGTIIIVALYMGNNLTLEQINISLDCIKSLRKHYPDEFIVIVDNNSPNRDWINIANDLNMHIITNTSELYRFEIGAYNLALKYFKADKYICIQHNILFKSRIRDELEIYKPDVYLFLTTTRLLWTDNGLNTGNGLELINKHLNYINMSNWNHDPLAVWVSFYCNDLMMEKLLNSGLLNLLSNHRDISQAYERILGVFFYRTTKNVKIINKDIFDKINFGQL